MTDETATMTGTGEGTATVTSSTTADGSATPSQSLESRPSDCSDLVDFTEMARRKGTTPNTVRSWRNRHPDFPAPVAYLAVGPVWRWEDVEPWLATRRKR
jgi:hypothetical protein